jgi:hypothetical protein
MVGEGFAQNRRQSSLAILSFVGQLSEKDERI